MVIALLVMFVAAFIFLKYEGIILEVSIILGVTWAVEKCKKEFGGISGDVAGFALVIGEVTGILVLAIIM